MSPAYRKYLASDEWKAKRIKVLKRDGYKCKLCGSTKNLNVHHKTYKRIKTVKGKIVANEKMRDLVTCCEWCHWNYFHGHANIFWKTYWKMQEIASRLTLVLFVVSIFVIGYNMYLSMTIK
jgi:heterodisulfide reductase subunit B